MVFAYILLELEIHFYLFQLLASIVSNVVWKCRARWMLISATLQTFNAWSRNGSGLKHCSHTVVVIDFLQTPAQILIEYWKNRNTHTHTHARDGTINKIKVWCWWNSILSYQPAIQCLACQISKRSPENNEKRTQNEMASKTTQQQQQQQQKKY